MTTLAYILFLMFRLSFVGFVFYGFIKGLEYSYYYDYYKPLMTALGM